MMRDQWKTALYPPQAAVVESQGICINKNKLSGFWGDTDMEKTLGDRGIGTLLFSGENTDQCVVASMQGAYTQGWDCLLLSDA